MQLSKRLKAVADMVTIGNRVADIGCDHAYIAINLIMNKISPFVVAMDVNQGPLDRAKENIERYRVADKISIRKSDGLQMLKTGEVDTILMAGMGGRLMTEILASRMDIVATAKELVLQPQSEIYEVRRTLEQWGFIIVDENMLKEDGKYYLVMKVRIDSSSINNNKYQLLKPEHIYYGRLLLEDKNPVLLEYLQSEKRLYKKIYNELIDKPTKQSRERQTEILELIQVIDQAMGYYKEGK
ncbi:MAG: SAM-dependent methyltransferase [Clostridiales bacterium]|nr:SAM-dependent methyltransferase [Clostridiales bacterium]